MPYPGTMLLFVKIFIAVGIILLIAEIARRVNPSVAGIVSGLPLGTGLALYFLTYEQGYSFARRGVIWGIAGLAASLSFGVAYFYLGRLFCGRQSPLVLFAQALFSIGTFVAVGFALTGFRFSLAGSLLFFCIFWGASALALRLAPVPFRLFPPRSFCLVQLLIRGLVAAGIMLLITGTAHITGPRWSGVLTSFPSVLLPVLLILQRDSGQAHYPVVIKGFSLGVSALAVFYLLYLVFVPRLGLNAGYVLAYCIVAVFLVVLHRGYGIIRNHHLVQRFICRRDGHEEE